jgi:sugar phosphate isomerase/epimerase
MRLACQEHLVPGDSLEAKWELLSAAGFDGIELHGHGDFAFERRLPELTRARDAGVPMPTVCVIMDHFIGDFDPGRRRDAIDNMKSLLSTIAEIGGEGAITPASFGMHSNALPPFRSPRSPQDDRTVLLEGLAELAQHAAPLGVTVLFEPLNRYEDHMVNRLDQGADLCEQLGDPAVQVMADLFHMNIEEDDSAAAIRRCGERVRHVHLADSGRAHPGTGHIDFGSVLAALKAVGFTGVMAMECGIRGEPREVLPGVARLLRSMM